MAPFTALQLLWVNLIMDTLGALALATEPPYDELMLNPPTGRFSNFISTVMWRNIIVQVIYQLSILTVLQYFGEELLELHGPDAPLYLNTMIFNAFVFCQVSLQGSHISGANFNCDIQLYIIYYIRVFLKVFKKNHGAVGSFTTPLKMHNVQVFKVVLEPQFW